MTLKITIEMDNAAFEHQPKAECRRIINKVLETMPNKAGWPAWEEKLRDINGNTVGTALIEE